MHLRSEVVDPCFIHCHIFTQKLFFVALEQLQTTLWIDDVLLFLIDCEQTQQPLWTQLSHWQMFMQNEEYIAFWYRQHFKLLIWCICFICFSFCLLCHKLESVGHFKESSTLMQVTPPEIWKWCDIHSGTYTIKISQCLSVNLRIIRFIARVKVVSSLAYSGWRHSIFLIQDEKGSIFIIGHEGQVERSC